MTGTFVLQHLQYLRLSTSRVSIQSWMRKKPPKRTRRAVAKLHASRPEARDEGPHLLPLDSPRTTEALAVADYHLMLADLVLNPKPKGI